MTRDELNELVEAWSDEAREKSAETRARNKKKSRGGFGGARDKSYGGARGERSKAKREASAERQKKVASLKKKKADWRKGAEDTMRSVNTAKVKKRPAPSAGSRQDALRRRRRVRERGASGAAASSDAMDRRFGLPTKAEKAKDKRAWDKAQAAGDDETVSKLRAKYKPTVGRNLRKAIRKVAGKITGS